MLRKKRIARVVWRVGAILTALILGSLLMVIYGTRYQREQVTQLLHQCDGVYVASHNGALREFWVRENHQTDLGQFSYRRLYAPLVVEHRDLSPDEVRDRYGVDALRIRDLNLNNIPSRGSDDCPSRSDLIVTETKDLWNPKSGFSGLYTEFDSNHNYSRLRTIEANPMVVPASYLLAGSSPDNILSLDDLGLGFIELLALFSVTLVAFLVDRFTPVETLVSPQQS